MAHENENRPSERKVFTEMYKFQIEDDDSLLFAPDIP